MVILDDIDSRSGSTVSLLRTFVGLYLRQIGGWIAVADLVALMQEVGVTSAAARNGIATLKQKKLLLPERREAIGYRLNPAAIPMLERGDRRIFNLYQMGEEDKWALISFSVAESERAKRYQLRKRLQWLGCGTVAPGLWITPEHLLEEVKLVLKQHDTEAVIFMADDPEVPGGFANSVEKWWDLKAIRDSYDNFLAHQNLVFGQCLSEADSFRIYLQVVDRWRPIPYLDPGLPTRLLPEDWPGATAFNIFTTCVDALQKRASLHVINSI